MASLRTAVNASRRRAGSGCATSVRSRVVIAASRSVVRQCAPISAPLIVIDHGVIVAENSPEAIRAQVPGKKVSFHSTEIKAEMLAGLPVESLLIENSRVSFLTSKPEEVLRTLFGRGVSIADLEVAGAGLEEAVLVLTGGR